MTSRGIRRAAIGTAVGGVIVAAILVNRPAPTSRRPSPPAADLATPGILRQVLHLTPEQLSRAAYDELVADVRPA